MLRIQGPISIEVSKFRRVAFDMDGVLSEKPPEGAKPWSLMSHEEKTNRRLNLNKFYQEAGILFNPPFDHFTIISSRRSDMDVAFLTDEWLRKQIGKGRYKLFLFSGATTLEKLAHFKVNVIMREKIEFFVSEDIVVMKLMAKFLEQENHNCMLVHFAPPEIPEMTLFYSRESTAGYKPKL